MYETFGPDRWLNPEKPLIDINQGVMNIMRIDEMDGVMKVRIDGQTIGKWKRIAQELPLRTIFHYDRGDGYHQYGRENPLHIANKDFWHISIRLEKEIRFRGKIDHGPEKKQRQEFFDSKAKYPSVPTRYMSMVS